MNRYAEWDAIAKSNSLALDELTAAGKFFVAASDNVDVGNALEEGMPRLGGNEFESAAAFPSDDYSTGEFRPSDACL